MSGEVFVILATSGRYDERYTRAVAAYDDLDSATRHSAAAQRYSDMWHKRYGRGGLSKDERKMALDFDDLMHEEPGYSVVLIPKRTEVPPLINREGES